MTALLANLTIRTKIGLILTTALLGFVAICVVYFIAQHRETVYLQQGRTYFEQVRIAEEISLAVANAQEEESRFYLERDEHAVNQFTQSLAKLFFEIDEARKNAPSGSEILLDRLKETAEEYQTAFRAVVGLYHEVGLNENLGLRGSLRASVHQVEELLSEFDQDRLTVLMLQMRRHEKDFMLRYDPKYVTRMADRDQEFAEALRASSINRANSDEIREYMAAYQRDFKQLTDQWLRLRAQIGESVEIRQRMDPLIERLVENAGESFREDNQALDDLMSGIRKIFIAVLLIVAFLTITVAALVGRDLTNATSTLSSALQSLAEGNLSAHIPGRDRGDEIGVMAQAGATFKMNAEEIEHMRTEERQRESVARLERQAQRRKSHEERRMVIKGLASDFQEALHDVVRSLARSSQNLQKRSSTMSDQVVESSDKSSTVADAAAQTTNAIRQLARSSTSLSHAITGINQRMSASDEIAGRAVEGSKKASETAQSLEAACNQISEGSTLIQKIAEKTNLLALNASIEAARAGEAGRGFAVVAGEVKDLASQTAEATRAIEEHIESIQIATSEVTQAINQVISVMNELNNISREVAGSLDTQAEATVGISRNISDISNNAGEITEAISDVTRSSKSTVQHADEIQNSVENLKSQTELLKQKSSNFLDKLLQVASQTNENDDDQQTTENQATTNTAEA